MTNNLYSAIPSLLPHPRLSKIRPEEKHSESLSAIHTPFLVEKFAQLDHEYLKIGS